MNTNTLTDKIKKLAEWDEGKYREKGFSRHWINGAKSENKKTELLAKCLERAIETLMPFSGRDGYEEVNKTLSDIEKMLGGMNEP